MKAIFNLSILFALAASVLASPIDLPELDAHPDRELEKRGWCNTQPGYCKLYVETFGSNSNTKPKAVEVYRNCHQLNNTYHDSPIPEYIHSNQLSHFVKINHLENKVFYPSISFNYNGITHTQCACYDTSYAIPISSCYCPFKCGPAP